MANAALEVRPLLLTLYVSQLLQAEQGEYESGEWQVVTGWTCAQQSYKSKHHFPRQTAQRWRFVVKNTYGSGNQGSVVHSIRFHGQDSEPPEVKTNQLNGGLEPKRRGQGLSESLDAMHSKVGGESRRGTHTGTGVQANPLTPGSSDLYSTMQYSSSVPEHRPELMGEDADTFINRVEATSEIESGHREGRVLKAALHARAVSTQTQASLPLPPPRFTINPWPMHPYRRQPPRARLGGVAFVHPAGQGICPRVGKPKKLPTGEPFTSIMIPRAPHGTTQPRAPHPSPRLRNDGGSYDRLRSPFRPLFWVRV